MSLHPKIIDLSLDRMHRILDALGNPENNIPPAIHIAGTNGKGSTQAMIRAGLNGAGLTCHAYTSPHLARFHERIRLADELITEPALAEVLEECEIANEGVPITYFEITTAAAFQAFSKTQADYTLLEVGLGGRLDATNVIDSPAITVITPVSVDHQQFLGDTIEQIAGEKAGILKRNCFGVVARQEEAALDVIQARADEVGATLKICGQHWVVWSENGRLVYQDEYGLLDLPMPALLGPHQVDNAGTAIATLRCLGQGDAESAMTDATWPARMQKLRKGPLIDAAPSAEIWLDGGHNAAAGQAIASTLDGLTDRPTFAVCGMLNTKDIGGYLSPLGDHIASLHAVSIPGETATLSAQETANAATAVGIDAFQSDDVLSAIQEITKTNPTARILICGSLYLAGAILRENS